VALGYNTLTQPSYVLYSTECLDLMPPPKSRSTPRRGNVEAARSRPQEATRGDGCFRSSEEIKARGRCSLDPKPATESPCGIVGFCTVVIHEDRVVATITKEGAAEFSDI
jgi:hypothetical protein